MSLAFEATGRRTATKLTASEEGGLVRVVGESLPRTDELSLGCW